MSEDKVVSILKQQHRTLDESVHSLTRETASIKDLALKNQEKLTVVDAKLTVFKHEVNERFDQLELLIRQAFPKN